MTSLLTNVFFVFALTYSGESLSSKIDFDDEKYTVSATNSTTAENEDVEVKHTIVVSTKVKNNNKGGLHSGDQGTLTYRVGHTEKPKDEEKDEVPIVMGNKAVDSTQIRTPDTRRKPQYYPDISFISRSNRDENDVYPNLVTQPDQWKPSSFFNNINWWNQDSGRDHYSFGRRNDPFAHNTVNFHRKVTDDSMRDFYCKKCSEYQGNIRCAERSNGWREVTPKVKLDGKLAKLN